MKKYMFAFIFILAACSAQPIQATVTPALTATLPPPTATILPTPTLNPQFLAIQTQVAASENYTIMGNGNVEGKLPDGTIGVINGIKLNLDGTGYTIMVNGAPVVIDSDKVSITDNGISIEGYTYDVATGNSTEGFDLATWAVNTEHGAEFVATIEALNYPKDNIVCDDKDVCFDLEGNKIWEKGIFNFSKAKEIAVKYGKPMPTKYGPATGNVLPGTPSKDVNKYVTWPLAQEFRTLLISSGKITKDEIRIYYNDFLLAEATNSWGIKFTFESDAENMNYFVYRNNSNQMIVIPIN